MSRTKLQKILNRLDNTNDKTLGAIRDFESGVKSLREKLQQEIEASTLEEVNLKINKLRKSIDLNPITQSLSNLESNFKESILSILSQIEEKDAQLKTISSSIAPSIDNRTNRLVSDIAMLKAELADVITANRTELNMINNELGAIMASATNYATKSDLEVSGETTNKFIESFKKIHKEDIKDIEDKINTTKIDLLNRIAQKGGGNMNRQIVVGGNASTLSKYTDINFKAGNNVTITYSANDTTKRTDITISATGGGASVGGTVRSINRISTSQDAGDATGTDYVYTATAGINLTLPTAVNNTNLYTIKNVSASSVLVSTTGGQTIDGDTSLILATQFTAVDLVNDGNDNWNIT